MDKILTLAYVQSGPARCDNCRRGEIYASCDLVGGCERIENCHGQHLCYDCREAATEVTD